MGETSIGKLVSLALIAMFIVGAIIVIAFFSNRGEGSLEGVWTPIIGTNFARSEFFGLYFGENRELQYYESEEWKTMDSENIFDESLKEFFRELDGTFRNMISRAEEQKVDIDIKGNALFDNNGIYTNFGKAIGKVYSDSQEYVEIGERLQEIKEDITLKNIKIEDRECRLYWEDSILYFKVEECFNSEWQASNFKFSEERFGIEDSVIKYYNSKWDNLEIIGTDAQAVWKREISLALKSVINDAGKEEILLGNFEGETRFDEKGNLGVSLGEWSYRLGVNSELEVYDGSIWKEASGLDWEKELESKLIEARSRAEETWSDEKFKFEGESAPFFQEDKDRLRLVVKVNRKY